MAVILIKEAKSLYQTDNDLEVDLKNNVFAIDGTVIDVSLSAFSWAKFRATKVASKCMFN